MEHHQITRRITLEFQLFYPSFNRITSWYHGRGKRCIGANGYESGHALEDMPPDECDAAGG